MICFYHNSDEKRSDALLARVYGIEGQEIVNREREFLSIQISHAAGCFPPIVATFQNGILYKYAPGRIVNFHDLVKPEVIRDISRKIYQLHNIDIGSIGLYNRKGDVVTYTETPKTVEDFFTLVKSIGKKPKNSEKVETYEKCRAILTDEYLLQECEFTRDILDEVKMPVSNVHGDFHPRNMVIDEDTGSVTFVDYDMAAIYYPPTDFALLFNSKPGFVKIGYTDPDEPDLTDEVCRKYLSEYLKCRTDSATGSKGEPSEKEIELLYIQCRMLWIVNHFRFMLIVLTNVDLELRGGLGIIDFLMSRIETYKEERGELSTLRDKYVELSSKWHWSFYKSFADIQKKKNTGAIELL